MQAHTALVISLPRTGGLVLEWDSGDQTLPRDQSTWDELMQEVWRPVVGWETRYEVSSMGRVRSLPYERRNGTGLGAHRRAGRLLRAGKNKGYLAVALCKEGFCKHESVHVLVAEAFLPPCPGKRGATNGSWQVDHRDGNKTNNSVENLRWLLAEQNRLLGNTKLTPEIIREIRRRREGGERLKALGVAFCKSQYTIQKICSGETWGWVT